MPIRVWDDMQEQAPVGERLWWGRFTMDLDAETRRDIFREIEVAKEMARAAMSSISGHERECAIRYQNIEKVQNSTSAAVEKIGANVQQIADKVGTSELAQTNKAKAVIISVLIAGLGIMGSALAWTAGQLYEREPARVAEHLKAE